MAGINAVVSIVRKAVNGQIRKIYSNNLFRIGRYRVVVLPFFTKEYFSNVLAFIFISEYLFKD